MTISDTDRAIQHNPDQSWPNRVRVELVWYREGVALTQAFAITGDEFFGLNGVGAPMEGAALIGRIENLRRQGPPSLGAMRTANMTASPKHKKPQKVKKNAKKR